MQASYGIEYHKLYCKNTLNSKTQKLKSLQNEVFPAPTHGEKYNNTY